MHLNFFIYLFIFIYTGGGCGRGSLREEGVVPVLGLDVDDAPDAPLRTEGEVGV